MPLPAEFEANPVFNFQPPSGVEIHSAIDPARSDDQREGSFDPIQGLIEAFTPESQTPAPTTSPPRTLLNRMVHLVSSPFRAATSSPAEADTTLEQRPRRTTAPTRLYQSEEEAQKEKDLKGKARR